MKTPERIKKGLECCNGDDEDIRCDGCPYAGEYDCVSNVTGDALALIQQLERQKNEMWTNSLSMQDALTKQERVRSNLQERISQLEVQVPRWISVKEKLPETQVDVLLFCKHESGGTDFVAVGSRAHWTPNRYYIDAVTTGIDADRITHWMPLTEPPEET